MQDDRKDQSGASDQDPPVLDYAALGGQKRVSAAALVTVATFGDGWEANLALNKLRAEGIEATLADEHIVGTGGGIYGNLAGGIKLQVPSVDVERARAALPKRSIGERVKCPRCRSFETRAATVNPILRMLYLLLLGMPYVLFGKRWTCAACGNVWRRSIYEEPDDEDDDDEDAGKSTRHVDYDDREK